MTILKLYEMIQFLKFRGHDSLQIVLTKKSILDLARQESELKLIDNEKIDYSNMWFAGYKVVLGSQDKIQLITNEVFL